MADDGRVSAIGQESSGERVRALVALLLLVPAASLGTWLLLYVWPGYAGKIAYGICKAWLVALPLGWLLWVERGRISLSPPRHGGLMIGAATGLVIGAAILAAHELVGGWIDLAVFREVLIDKGFGNKIFYLGAAVYIILINAALEEYVWRWFVFRQCEKLLRSGWLAVGASALLFTLHHVVALRAYTGWNVTLLGSAGVFLGGATWSALYARYRSVWPGYLSHIGADVAIYLIGWELLYPPAAG